MQVVEYAHLKDDTGEARFSMVYDENTMRLLRFIVVNTMDRPVKALYDGRSMIATGMRDTQLDLHRERIPVTDVGGIPKIDGNFQVST